MTDFKVDCGECGAPMMLNRGTYGRFYSCTRWPKCGGSHGAHPDGAPLGTPANATTRRARVEAHAAFDRLWRPAPDGSRRMSRKAAYRWLQKAMSVAECDGHIASFDVAQCDRLIRLVNAHLEARESA